MICAVSQSGDGFDYWSLLQCKKFKSRKKITFSQRQAGARFHQIANRDHFDKVPARQGAQTCID
jgi:hypothetical protein